MVTWEQALERGEAPRGREGKEVQIAEEGEGQTSRELRDYWVAGWKSTSPPFLLAPMSRFGTLLKKEESSRLSQLLKVGGWVVRRGPPVTHPAGLVAGCHHEQIDSQGGMGKRKEKERTQF